VARSENAQARRHRDAVFGIVSGKICCEKLLAHFLQKA
jgi:hypothetical protein